MKYLPMRGLNPVRITLLAISFGLLIASCNDSAIPEVEVDLPEQNSFDTPEAYIEAIAKAQTNLVSHASSAMREMDEEEFEKVMRNAEKVLERSPVYSQYYSAEGDFEVKKFSEEEYRLQTERYESDRQDFLDALSPIISPEIYGEIQSLITEFVTVYGGAEVDTTGWKKIMHKANQDALAQETSSLSCSSPQQITVNQASILPMPSIATIMGWFGRNEMQNACGSCCIECCGCKNGCHEEGYKKFSDAQWAAITTFGTCVAISGWVGPISWGSCAVGGLVAGDIMFVRAIWFNYRCDGKCRNNPACVQCPAGINEWWPGTSCRTADRW